MNIALHLFLFLLSSAVMWGLSGLLVQTTDRVAKRFNKPGFFVAFFVLGIMTSIGEISVATNATLHGVPGVSAGNLIGGVLVLFLFVIPVLAIFGNGIPMHGALGTKGIAFLLVFIALPSFFVLDGDLTRTEGLIVLILYATALYAVQRRKAEEAIVLETVEHIEEELLRTGGLLHRHKATALDVAKIAVAGILIFIAGNILVNESVFFANLLSVPPSLVGLLLLSVGTNIPELVIAARCIVSKQTDIAFGDYLGSAAANTAIVGVLAVANGPFALERSEFVPTFVLLSVGLALFFVFSRTKHHLSRGESLVLLSLYGVFLILQMGNAVTFMLGG